MHLYDVQNVLFDKKQMYLLAEKQLNLKYKSMKQKQKIVNNAHLIDGIDFTEENTFPIIKKYSGNVDFELVSYGERNKFNGKNQAVHFFLDDFKFSYAVWNRLSTTTPKLQKFDYVLTPDFSLYVDLPDILNKINLYKTRFVGAYWQKCGYNVIPTASWGSVDSFKYCFEGLPEDSVIAVSGIGHSRTQGSKILWHLGLKELVTQKRPSLIIIYGPEENLQDLKTPIKYFPDYITKNFKNDGRDSERIVA